MSPEIMNPSVASKTRSQSGSDRYSNSSYYSSCQSSSLASNTNVRAINRRSKPGPKNYIIKGIIDLTREQYKNDFKTFLLNNMVMAVVLFENYEEDLKVYQSEDSPRAQEIAKLNEKFKEKHNRSLIFADTFFEALNRNVAFRRCCDSTATSLIPERIFVVDETIEINEGAEECEQKNNNDDDLIDQIPRVLLMSADIKGFVLLKNRLYRKSTVSSTASSYQSGDPSHASSSSCASSGEIDWSLKKIAVGIYPQKRKKSFFKRVRNEYFWSPYKRNTLSNQSIESGTSEKIHTHDEYYSATQYAEEFNREFDNKLISDFGFDLKKLDTDSSVLSTISCESRNNNGNVINYEITCASSINFPDEDTCNWWLRKQKEMPDPKTNKPMTWLSKDDILAIRNKKCLIIPRCAILKTNNKSNHNIDQEEIEWEIAFPRAEMYLQSRMTHAQTKTYLLLVLLHRSFIEPLTQQTGIRPEHIKMMFYRELEEDFVKFPETRMGAKLIDMLNILYLELGGYRRKHLNNYFYGSAKNILDNLQDIDILLAQNIVNQIINNKVEYFIAALLNLQYTSSDYFPKFDFLKLHGLLTDENLVSKPAKKSNLLEKPTLIFNGSRIKSQKSAEQPQEWIDLKIPCKVGSIEAIRKVKSLQMFIEHFIKVGKVCFAKSNKLLGKAYYLQARDLTTILEEQGHLGYDAEKYKQSIMAGCPELMS